MPATRRSAAGLKDVALAFAVALGGSLVLVLPAARAEGLSEKESFMLMFGKGNGAMRVLCALQRDGLLSNAQRLQYRERLDTLLLEPSDDASQRRNLRVGIAFAEGRASLCPPGTGPSPQAGARPDGSQSDP